MSDLERMLERALRVYITARVIDTVIAAGLGLGVLWAFARMLSRAATIFGL